MLRRACVLMCVGLGFVVFDSHSLAARKPDLSFGSNDLIYGGSSDFSKASRDTHFLIGPWGSGASVNGQFQDGNGQSDWNGWTHRDLTQPSVSHWQLSDYHADNLPGGTGNIAAWCGDISFIPCWVGEPEGGYGNSWYDIIEWRATVPDPSVGVDVTFTAVANIDSEPGYDGTEIVYYDVEGRILASYFDGLHPALPIDVTFSLAPEDYQGIGNNEVLIQVSFHSDGAWSDEDCQWPSAGAVQIDDITVTLNQGEEDVVSTTDFESGWGDWTIVLPAGVGDFAQIWTNLEDVDPCATNYSPQVAFIDDGIVVPGVGPSLCIDWCYGPGGYIVNTTGGALGEPHHLNNVVESPVIPWPSDQAEGARLWFDVFHHEDLSADSPGVFYFWNIRSTASEDPADIENAVWDNNQIWFYGNSSNYYRYQSDVSSLLDPSRRFVQVQLGLREIGYMWDWDGDDGYPAPYLDNVRLVAYPYAGPSISAREMNLAQDSFPAGGTLDLDDLASNSVRFDMARNISMASEQVNLPGDSIVVDIVLLGEGTELVGEPEIVLAMKANPVFDEFRILPAGLTQNGNLIEGAVPGVPAVNASGPAENQWAFDLPDENFFFPGDIIHYYIRATGTDGATQQTSTLPASDPDTGLPMGFLDFLLPASCDRAYNSSFIVRALPSVYEKWGELTTPKALVWNDFGNRVGVDDWFTFFAYRCLPPGEYYDIYTTNSPQSGLGNGLGGRATVETLEGYDAIFYTSGDLSFNTLSDGDFGNDAGNDLALLDDWLRLGNNDMFLSGDGLVFDLMVYAGSAGSQFVSDWMKVSFESNDLRPLINNQTTTLVQAMPGNGVFDGQENWFADGDCPGINTFDAVEVDYANGGERLAEFTDPNGNPGGYNYSAATLYTDPEYESKILSLPYDLRYVPSGGWDLDSGRERILINAWQLFGLPYPSAVPTHCNDCGEFVSVPDPQEVPGSVQFGIRNYPNPFNPSTRIEYSIPQASHLTLKIFNLKGELVRTLIDERVESSGSIEWDGTDNVGARVGSGVYFCQAQAGGKVQVQKLAIIK